MACGFVLLCALLATRSLRTPPLPAVFWALGVCWMVTSLMWASPTAWDTSTLFTIVQLFVLYFVVSLYPARESDLKGLLIAALVGGAIATLYGLGVSLTGVHAGDQRLWLSSSGGEVDPNHFAAALLLPLIIALTWGMHVQKRLPRVVLVASALLISVGIFLSGSRGAVVSAAIALTYLAWRKRAYLQLGAFSLAAGALSLVFPTVWQRFVDPTQAGGAGRTWIWEVGLAAARDHWLFGTGIGTFARTYNQVFLTVYQPVNEGWSRASHNFIVGAVVELGIVGLVLLLLAWFSSFRALLVIPEGSRVGWMALALQGALLALFVESFFLDLLTLKYYWVTFALVAVAHQAFRTEVEETKEAITMLRKTDNFAAAWNKRLVS
jgi:O-antigen ligase